eukprot:COSAG06_NODE_31840_length_515_cov_0.459135_1_plen_128_part_10
MSGGGGEEEGCQGWGRSITSISPYDILYMPRVCTYVVYSHTLLAVLVLASPIILSAASSHQQPAAIAATYSSCVWLQWKPGGQAVFAPSPHQMHACGQTGSSGHGLFGRVHALACFHSPPSVKFSQTF